MYVYLQPIFTFEDINKSLGPESAQFAIVNRSWMSNIDFIDQNPLVLSLYNLPNLLPTLKNNLDIME